MSALAALGLRLAILDALGQPVAGQYPTVAGQHIYDSRLGEILPDEIGYQPAVVISIESRKGESLSAINGGVPMQPAAQIVFALHVFIRATYEVDAEGGGTETITGPVVAGSDAEAEDLLDILESQILQTLDNAGWVRRFASRWLTALESEPYRNDEGERYATRALSISATLAEDATGDLARFQARTDLAGHLAARAASALARRATTQAILDHDIEVLEAAHSVLIKDVLPANAPASSRIEFSGI